MTKTHTHTHTHTHNMGEDDLISQLAFSFDIKRETKTI